MNFIYGLKNSVLTGPSNVTLNYIEN